MEVTVFLPCRRGSQRVPDKNTRPFAGYAHGLIEIKLKQILAARGVHKVVLSTNDEEILAFAKGLGESRLQLHRRDNALGSNDTSTDALIAHAATLISGGHILWTHVTSPFFGVREYERAIEAYNKALDGGFDSLMTASVLRSFLWDKEKPVNYDRAKTKWPHTQDLPPFYEINNAVFLASADIYHFSNDRIGTRPCFYPVDKITGFDIDWLDDFELAERLAQAGIASV